MDSKHIWVLVYLLLFLKVVVACGKQNSPDVSDPDIEEDLVDNRSLRQRYETNTNGWPTAEWYENIVKKQELEPILSGPSSDSLGINKIALGKALFFDTRMGGNNGHSCASFCHRSDAYFSDQMARGVAVGQVRNTPTMENVWYLKGNLFHDGRAKTYAEQIEEAITSPIEMNQPMETLPAKLAAFGTYQPLFAEAYGDAAITRERILDAIAAYSQTIVSDETRFDRFLKGHYDALTDQEIQGMHLFRTKAKCINCHNGPYFTDLQYHNFGYSSPASSLKLDSGRYVATGLREDIGRFRTLGLRNVANTYPYFHNGAFATLKDLIDAKNDGMPRGSGHLRVGTLSPYIKPLGLTEEEKETIIAFLSALSSDPVNN